MHKYDNLGRGSYQWEACWAAEVRRNKVLIVLCRCPHLRVSLIRLKSAGELYEKQFFGGKKKTLLWAEAVLSQKLFGCLYKIREQRKYKGQTRRLWKGRINIISDGRAEIFFLCGTRGTFTVAVLVPRLSNISIAGKWWSRSQRCV